MTTIKPRSLFRWAGSKAHMMPRLIPLMPHHTCYVSLFGGSGADIIHKPRTLVEIYNDINTDVVNVFRMLRSDKNRRWLCQQLAMTPFSRLQYAECLGINHSDEDDPLKRAWAFLYCTLTRCNNADPAICTEVSFGVPKKQGLRSDWHNMGERVESVGRRFREVIMEKQSFERIIPHYDTPETLFYADPPYVMSTRTARYYKDEMSDEQHATLLDALTRVVGFVMLSGYDNDLYRERLAGWRRKEWKVLCSTSSAKKKPVRTEVVWMNYDKDGQRLAR